MLSSRLAAATLALAVGVSVAAPRPALADGAASTRNIIFGAAAVGGTMLVVNHNKKVHQKYAEYDRRQMELETERNQAQAAYRSERSAYQREVALVRAYRRQIAYQRSAIHRRDLRIATLKHSLIVAKYGVPRRTAFVQATPVQAAPAQAQPARPSVRRAASGRTGVQHGPPRPAAIAVRHQSNAQTLSYGWGAF